MRLCRVLVCLVMALAVATGCQKIKSKLGIGDEITKPDPGTPEKLVQDVLGAAVTEDEEEGWELFTPLLHSDEVDSPAALNDWRSIKFPSIRRKADYLLTDRSALEFSIMERRTEGKALIIFVDNSKSDSSTPCKLRQDPSQGNAWRVYNSCF